MPGVEISLDVVLIGVCSACGIMDARHRRIPDWLTLPGMVVGVLLRGVFYGAGGVFDVGWVASVLGLVFCLLLFGLFAVWGKGMGAGDVKLMGAVGALAGFRHSLTAVMCIALMGALLALVLLLAKRGVRGLVQLVSFRRRADGDQKLTLPYAVPIALGAIWATLRKYGIL